MEKCLTIFFCCFLGGLYIHGFANATVPVSITLTVYKDLVEQLRYAFLFSSQSHMFSYYPPLYSTTAGALCFNNLHKTKLQVYMNFNWKKLKVLSRNVYMRVLSGRAIICFPCSYNYYFALKVVLFKPME